MSLARGQQNHTHLILNKYFKLIFEVYISCFPSGASVKESACQCRRRGFHPWVRKIPWKRTWQPTPVFLLEEFHGQRSLAGYSSRGCKESDTSEWLTNRPEMSKYLIEVVLVVKNPPANAGNTWQYSCLQNPMDKGAWWVVVHSVTKSQTQLKQLSMHTLNQ